MGKYLIVNYLVYLLLRFFTRVCACVCIRRMLAGTNTRYGLSNFLSVCLAEKSVNVWVGKAQVILLSIKCDHFIQTICVCQILLTSQYLHHNIMRLMPTTYRLFSLVADI